MKKFLIAYMLLFITRLAFPDELDIARQYIYENKLLANFKTLKLNLKDTDGVYFLFYIPFDGKVIIEDDNATPIVFHNGVIVKVTKDNEISVIEIKRNGVIRTEKAILFNFSESGYEHVQFDGWILRVDDIKVDDKSIKSLNIQLTQDGTTRIAADLPLPSIIWTSKYNYPVTYGYSKYLIPQIKCEWHEDEKIVFARSGIPEEKDMFEPSIVFNYLDGLNSYDKKVIVNAMFALHGYDFVSREWYDFFSKYFWYSPNESVKNSSEILDADQRRLLEYLLK